MSLQLLDGGHAGLGQQMQPGQISQCQISQYGSQYPYAMISSTGISSAGNYFFSDGANTPYTNNNKENKKMGTMEGLKSYYQKHQDILFTIGFVLLLDYFLFGGALHIRIKAMVEKMISGVEEKLHVKEIADGTTTK